MNDSDRTYRNIAAGIGVLLLVGLILGVIAFGMMESRGAMQAFDYCTNSAFYYFDVPPAVGDLGNYSTVSITRIGNHVRVSMIGLLFYGLNAMESSYWSSLAGYPFHAGIGIDAACIPSISGRADPLPFNGSATCTPAGSGFRSFDVGSMYISALQPTLFLNVLTNTFVEGGSPAACIASLPEGQTVVYHHTLLNPEWFIPSGTWIPNSWSVEFAYVTGADDDWSPPGHCKTNFKEHCTLPR